MLLTGDIDFRAPLAFKRALAAHPETQTVVLNSGGGSVQAALLVAEEVFERNMNTFILEEMQCLSACSFVFFAGRERIAEGKLGVHQISGTDDIEDAQLNLSDILETLSKYEVSPGVISRMLRTSPDSMHIFTSKEIASLGINRIQFSADAPETQQNPEISNTFSSPDVKSRKETAKAFVLGLIRSGSLPPNELINMARSSYSDTVEFYGKQMSKHEVLEDKRQYALRWPVRFSTARPESIGVSCFKEFCRVSGIYDWSVSNVRRKKYLKGHATFEYVIRTETRGVFRIVSENGKVLERSNQ